MKSFAYKFAKVVTLDAIKIRQIFVYKILGVSHFFFIIETIFKKKEPTLYVPVYIYRDANTNSEYIPLNKKNQGLVDVTDS